MTHIILAAENEVAGACWIAAYDPAILKAVINPDENQVIFGMIPLGNQKPGFRKKSRRKRKSLAEVVDYL